MTVAPFPAWRLFETLSQVATHAVAGAALVMAVLVVAGFKPEPTGRTRTSLSWALALASIVMLARWPLACWLIGTSLVTKLVSAVPLATVSVALAGPASAACVLAQLHRPRSPFRSVWAIAAACTALLALVAEAVVMSYRLEPWAQVMHDEPLLATGVFVAAQVSASLGLAACATIFRAAREPWHHDVRPWLTALLTAGAMGVATAVLTWELWLPAPIRFRIHFSPAPTPQPAQRLAVVAALSWLTLGLAGVMMHLRSPTHGRSALNRALPPVAVLGLVTCLMAAHQLCGPWHIRGELYANGITGEQARSLKSSAAAIQLDANQSTGAGMVDGQCRFCHAPSSLRARIRASGPARLKEVLGELQQADRPGNRYWNVMPPLVGTPSQVEAMRLWMLTEPHEPVPQ